MSYPPPTFELTVETVDDRTAGLRVRGEVHLRAAADVSEGLSQGVPEGRTAVVVDLTEVGFIDSTGLSVLLNALRRITRAGGTLVLVCTNPTVLRLFEVTKMDTTFTIVSSRDEAVEKARG